MEPWMLLDKFVFAVGRRSAHLVVKPLMFLRITPNQVTVLNFLIFASLATFSYAQGTYYWGLLGLLFCVLQTYFDFVDGLLARKIGATTRLGGWLDGRLDFIFQSMLLGGIGYGIYQANETDFWLLCMLLAFFGQVMIIGFSATFEQIIWSDRKRFVHEFAEADTGFFDGLIKEIVILDSFVFLFLGTFRYLLVLGTVFNQLKWAFLMITIVSNVRWPVLFLVNTKCVDERPSKLAVIELFRKFLITS